MEVMLCGAAAYPWPLLSAHPFVLFGQKIPISIAMLDELCDANATLRIDPVTTTRPSTCYWPTCHLHSVGLIASSGEDGYFLLEKTKPK